MAKITWEIKNHTLEDLLPYKDDIINLYNQNMQASKIAKQYQTYDATIARLLKENNIAIRKRTVVSSEELKKHSEEIAAMYLNENLSPQKIGEKFGANRGQINYLLQQMGIQKDTSNGKRKYKINEHYFDEIDTPNKAYILGFLYADGCVYMGYNDIVKLSLSQDDIDILEDIRKELGCEKPFYLQDYTDKNGIRHRMATMTICSTHMCNMLIKWRCTPQKTFKLEFPDFLDENLYSHFIRGYFDGDGCACITKNDIYQILHVTLMSSINFCVELQEFLQNKQNIIFHVNHPSGKKYENGLLRSGNKKETKKFFEYIYKDADLYMKRKYNKFLIYFNM